jgi:hypothetical protein
MLRLETGQGPSPGDDTEEELGRQETRRPVSWTPVCSVSGRSFVSIRFCLNSTHAHTSPILFLGVGLDCFLFLCASVGHVMVRESRLFCSDKDLTSGHCCIAGVQFKLGGSVKHSTRKAGTKCLFSQVGSGDGGIARYSSVRTKKKRMTGCSARCRVVR